MTVQGIIVLAILSVAVMTLLRRARRMLAPAPKKGPAPSCHGCDDCGTD